MTSSDGKVNREPLKNVAGGIIIIFIIINFHKLTSYSQKSLLNYKQLIHTFYGYILIQQVKSYEELFNIRMTDDQGNLDNLKLLITIFLLKLSPYFQISS